MRRTEQEFKTELEKRCRTYRREQIKKRKILLSIGLCICIFCVTVVSLDPFGAASEAPKANMMLMGDGKLESNSISQQTGSGAPADAAPAERAPAQPAPEAEEGTVTGTSRTYNVVSIEVKSSPAYAEFERLFISKEKIVPVMIALERFYPADDMLREVEPGEGMAYQITVTYTNQTRNYTLFGDGLCSDEEGWIRLDGTSARKLEAALSQESDVLPDISVRKINSANSWPLDVADTLMLHNLLNADVWAEGSTRSHMDCSILVDGIAYTYSSGCGVFYDAQQDTSLILEEGDRLALNAMLGSYLAWNPAEDLSVRVICGGEEITLNAEDSAIVMGYLTSGRWDMAASNCLCDFTLEAAGETYHYHSDCGTIQNESGDSLTLPEADRKVFNSIVGKCPVRLE